MSNSSTSTTMLARDQTSSLIICYAPAMITTNGVWQGDNPLDYSLPLFIVQLILVVVTTRALVYILKPFRQPHVIAEILGGIILGPSVLGQSDKFANTLFPLRSVMVLETMANIGLLYFLFLVGVEMDLNVIKRTGRKAISIAIGGMVLPFVIGCTFSLFMLGHINHSSHHQPTYVLFLGVALSVTTFPVLARILAELKLINTNMGQIAMSSALVNDVCAWILLALAIALADTDARSLTSLWVVLSCVFFIIFCIFVVRPIIEWLIKQTPEGEPISDFHICLILTGVMISGFITDALGTHSVFGAFVFGLIIPNGTLATTLIERLEDFVSGLLLPLFFAISGLKTDISKVPDVGTWMNLLVVILLSCIAKVAGTSAIAHFHNMPFREGIALGLLMNTKGLVEMIVLNVGKDQKVLDDSSFSIMVVASLVITATITPLVTLIYKPARKYVPYKRRTIQSTKPDTELRVLSCVHTPKNVPTMINFLDASYSTRKSPLHVFVLHLVELTGRASSMLIVHTTRRKGDGQSTNRTQAQSEHIIAAFETYQQQAQTVRVNPITAISPYESMHEDICNVAQDKRVAFIILPFHKQQSVDGGMETTNPSFRTINQNVLANAPCSVGILVDRGLNGSTRMGSPNPVASKSVVVFFFGGPDDREALSYALRMSQHSGIHVTVIRFISMSDQPKKSQLPHTNLPNNQNMLTVVTDVDQQRQFDEECINEFRTKTGDKEAVSFQEKLVNNAEETVRAIRGMDKKHDLYIVGRGEGITTPLTAGLTEWAECPELGVIGDLLASSDFSSTVSVLVVQQYVGLGPSYGSLESPTPASRFDFDDIMGEFKMGFKF